MNQRSLLPPRLFALAGLMFLFVTVAPARTTTPFDGGWRFLKADAPDAEQVEFNDSTWRKLDVPHDWSIGGPFAQTNKTGGAGGFLPSGVGWYRKAFTLPESASNQCVFIEFDGVMANSTVWINGRKLGHRPNGYVSFRYELTPHLKLGSGATNLLAVRADTAAQPASRWYTGAGIYRHVRVVTTDQVHLEVDSVFITTPQVTSDAAIVRMMCAVTNQLQMDREVTVELKLQNANGAPFELGGLGKPVTVPAGAAVSFVRELQIHKPALWSPDNPSLSLATVLIRVGTNLVDYDSLRFGVREAQFTPEQGFVLNGKKVMLKGVCLHHDGGALGAAVPLGVWEQRLVALRELGCNAIRTSHNSVAPEFLDLCDRMGFLVMDEFFDCWTVGKTREDYHKYFDEWSLIDLRDTVRRDRNHPSIILYSAGNEIHDTPKPELAKRILAGLVKEYKANDPTRPVTQALFRPNVSGDYTNGLADLLDVVGTNYRDKELLAAQRAKPERKIVGTEQKHDRETWLDLRDNPSHAGQFLWTGVDYLGESRQWPRVGHASGLLDRTGAVKPRAFEHASWWSDAPMVRIVRRVAPDDKMPTDPGYGGAELHTQVEFADWTPSNPAPHDESLHAYSNCEEVELFLNGKSLGAKKINADATPRVWKIPFAPGLLRAVARNSSKVAANDELRTAGAPSAVKLQTLSAKLGRDWDDVAIVRAYIVDKDGVVVPSADDLIAFTVTGPGVIAAVDNGDNDSSEPFQARERKAYGGRCVAIVRATAATGTITVIAEAAGLQAGSVVIESGKP